MDKTIWKLTVLCMIFVPYTSTTSDFCDNIVLHAGNGAADWSDAMKMCESYQYRLVNTHDIKQLSSCNQSYENIWFDKFQYLSPWIELYGCYTWHDNALDGMKAKKSRFIPAICDRKCPNSNFFGIQNNHCYCISEDFKKNYLIKTAYSNCSSSCILEPNLNCGGQNAMNLYRRVPSDQVIDPSKRQCSSLNCQTNGSNEEIQLYGNDCADSLFIVCDNGESNSPPNKWAQQTEYCQSRGYPHKYITTNDIQNICKTKRRFWSGVFRSAINGTSNFLKGISNSWEHPKIGCYKFDNVNGTFVITSAECNDIQNYICIKDENISSTPSQMKTSSTKNPWTTTEQSVVSVTLASETTIDIYTSTNVESNTSNSNSTSKSPAISDAGIIVGVIVPTVVVLCIVVFIIIAKKRGFILSGLKSKDEEIADKKLKPIDVGMNNAQNEEKENHIYTETVNPGYEFAKPMDNGSNQGYEIAKPFSNSKGLNGGPSRNDYEFAAVINDDDYVYTDTKEGEYDTFQNKEKRKIRVDEGNLYSHTTAGLATDNDYDTTYGTKVNDTGDIYDHTTVKQNIKNNIDANPYDHI